MHYFAIILALAAATWAIDIRAFIGDSHCHDRYGYKVGAQPDTCYHYYDNSGMSSFGFYAIPKDWRISTRGHGGGNCKDVLRTQDSNGATWVCHGDKRPKYEYTGAGYSFINKKAELAETQPAADDAGECKGMDGIVFENGGTYDLKDADEADKKIMVSAPALRGRLGEKKMLTAPAVRDTHPSHRTQSLTKPY